MTTPFLTEKRIGHLFLFPSLALLAGVALLPLASTWEMSLHRYIPIFHIDEFVGIRNYTHLLQNPRFHQSLKITLGFTFLSVGMELLLGLGLALWIHRKARTQALWYAAILLPWVIPTSVSAKIWDLIFNAHFGILNYFLERLGWIPHSLVWTGNPKLALPAALLAEIWKTAPFVAMILLAGLKGISVNLYRAAQCDGAGSLQSFFHVTLPLLLPSLGIAAMFRSMDAFRIFDLLYVLTGGGPANTTETLSIYAYKVLFRNMEFGYGSALACIIFLAVFSISLLYIFWMQRLEKRVG